MSHRIVDSGRSSVAFSWEDSPGVSKYFARHQNFSSSSNYHFNGGKIPPPPPCAAFRSAIIGESSSMRDSPCDDPFIAALIECTKNSNVGNSKMPPTDYEPIRKNNGSSKGSKKSSYSCIFSCIPSSDHEVKVGNFVKLSNLPPLPKPRPRGRYRSLTSADDD
ncbi:hypothetical protein HAX54_011321 [Datura stramonium]|uniref:Uncharacterized protein n=1 Tax=Datura stramonium TaxID=4076 RepID=A0ABS8THT1_DATST|nr:hypothetical protein [Datura stramonium]